MVIEGKGGGDGEGWRAIDGEKGSETEREAYCRNS